MGEALDAGVGLGRWMVAEEGGDVDLVGGEVAEVGGPEVEGWAILVSGFVVSMGLVWWIRLGCGCLTQDYEDCDAVGQREVFV